MSKKMDLRTKSSLSSEAYTLRNSAARLSSLQAKPIIHRRVTELSSKKRPSIRKSLKSKTNFITPSVSQLLHTGELKDVVGREKEISFLQSTIEKCLLEHNSNCIYVSGSPGTGKTATVTEVVQAFTISKKCQSVFINCMQLTTPRKVFTSILDHLDCKSFPKVSAPMDKVVNFLENVLVKKSSNLPLIIVLDEIDQLESKFQEVLYTIFGWPSHLSGELVLIGIANALDLTDRLLPNLQSRSIRPVHLAFQPYSTQQIVDIISTRLLNQSSACQVIPNTGLDKLAVQFCAKKVAACSGDIRTALAVCRRAVELAGIESNSEINQSEQVYINENLENLSPLQRRMVTSPALNTNKNKFTIPTMRHVSKAIQEAQSGGDLAFSRSSFKQIGELDKNANQHGMPLHHKLVLATGLLLRRLRGINESSVGQMFDLYSHVCSLRQLTALDMSEFVSVLELLDSHGLIRLGKPTGGSRNSLFMTSTRMKRISLLLDDKGVERNLNDNLLLSSIISIRSIP